MISVFIIKTALLRFGVVIQDVKFDIDGECIIVNYISKGEQKSKSVPFQEIEELFTADLSGQAASQGDK